MILSLSLYLLDWVWAILNVETYAHVVQITPQADRHDSSITIVYLISDFHSYPNWYRSIQNLWESWNRFDMFQLPTNGFPMDVAECSTAWEKAGTHMYCGVNHHVTRHSSTYCDNALQEKWHLKVSQWQLCWVIPPRMQRCLRYKT